MPVNPLFPHPGRRILLAAALIGTAAVLGAGTPASAAAPEPDGSRWTAQPQAQPATPGTAADPRSLG
jgi:hypothetical protein